MLVATGCAPEPSTTAREPDVVVGWQTLGSWSGRGSIQTESFLFEGGILRVRWETESKGAPATGTFHLVLHSAVSGRLLAVAAEHLGTGKGEFYIPEEPRPAYFVIESEGLDWSFTVEEGKAGVVLRTSAAEAARVLGR